MFGKSAFFAVAFAASLTAPLTSIAQDAGVSGIPHGPGSIGGLNNSINDPSGLGNAAKIPPLPQPQISAPVVPAIPPPVTGRIFSRSMPIVKRFNRQAIPSRREFRRSSVQARSQVPHKPPAHEISICRGC